jgi:hypothetical protein
MKKGIILGIIALIFLLSGCGKGDNWKVEFTKEPQFIKEKESSLEIKVTEGDKPVTDLDASAHFEMASMSHGEVDVNLEEGEDGLYTGKVGLPMKGKYSVIFTFKKDGDTVEKAIEVEVKEVKGVATINGEPISNEDIEFYRFINNLHIAINREADKASLKGAELEEKMEYWDSQEKLNDNNNTLLTQIIRLRAMAMLAKEKGHQASSEEVKTELDAIRAKYNQSPVAVQLIKDFGESKFWDIEQKQYEMIVLTKKVQQDVKELVKKENPNVSDQEVSFLAQKKYEELLVSQVNSLKIEIL